METAPDGYRGWIGPYIYGPQVWCDVRVGDAILASPTLHFGAGGVAQYCRRCIEGGVRPSPFT
jgi:hypothetical protein